MPTNNLTQNKNLIMDDQESNLALLEGLLKKKGYSQFKSLTGSRQVIPTFREWQPDLILLDLMMPHMDVLRPLVPPRLIHAYREVSHAQKNP